METFGTHAKKTVRNLWEPTQIEIPNYDPEYGKFLSIALPTFACTESRFYFEGIHFFFSTKVILCF